MHHIKSRTFFWQFSMAILLKKSKKDNTEPPKSTKTQKKQKQTKWKRNQKYVSIKYKSQNKIK